VEAGSTITGGRPDEHYVSALTGKVFQVHGWMRGQGGVAKTLSGRT
jgi:hypothetical protein